jgi:hypothetical protein
MRILADTSVWVDHLRNGNDQLAGLLKDGSFLRHRFVVGEWACVSQYVSAEVIPSGNSTSRAWRQWARV